MKQDKPKYSEKKVPAQSGHTLQLTLHPLCAQ